MRNHSEGAHSGAGGVKKRIQIAGTCALLVLLVSVCGRGQTQAQASGQAPARSQTAPQAKAQAETNPAAKDPAFVKARQEEQAGRLAEAEKLVGDRVQALEDIDPDSAELVPFLKLFAEICVKKKELPEAHAAYEQALEIDEEMYGPADSVSIHDLLDLGATADANSGEAEQDTLQALAMAQRNPNPMPGTFVEVLNRLAALYQAQRRWPEAEGYASQGMEICKATKPAPAGCGALEQKLAAVRRQSRSGEAQGNGRGADGNKGRGEENPDDEGP
jgi:tetratricopeptide (TPR) repeat protein